MAKKIYDFLPGHLKNNELETVFETTLDRVFSVGEMEKTKAFVGRKEKGIYNSKDAYLSFPTQSYARDNYGLEPTFTNTDATDNVFYDDLLNALYNKGALTNDHRRLFKSTLETVQLPIDLDKFVNYSMYYWVSPGFVDPSVITGSINKHYVTIDKDVGSWWSTNNSWYHYDDIKSLITDSNFTLISQALRPIIEFDKDIELSTQAAAVGIDVTAGAFVIGTEYIISDLGTTTNDNWNSIAGTHSSDPVPTYAVGDIFTAVWEGPTNTTGTAWAKEGEIPTFKSYDSDDAYVKDINIFHYVIGANYTTDTELGFKPKLKAGDYQSEFVFNIDLDETSTYKYNTDYKNDLLSKKISIEQAILDLINNSKSLILKDMMKDETNDELKAYIYYSYGKISNDSSSIKQSKDLYKKLYKATKDFNYKYYLNKIS